MKKILKISLVMVGILSTLNAGAVNPYTKLDLKKVEGKKVSFALDEMQKVKMSIFDSSNTLIYNEDLSEKKQLFRTYDLDALPEGIYYMQTENDLKISKYKIEVYGKVATLSPEAISEVFKPVFDYKVEKGLLKVSFLENIKTPISIEVYDSNNELLYSKTDNYDQMSSTVYNLKNIDGEECSFVVSYSGNSFGKTISL